MGRRGKRGLSDEDRTLWSRVAETTTPLQRKGLGTRKDSTFIAPSSNETPLAAPLESSLPAFRLGEKAPGISGSVLQTPSLSNHIAQTSVRMDHGTHKQMVRGKLKPEARIDLHGMTLAEAHPALISFIFQSHESGKRLVLVITGKGKDRDGDGPIPSRRGVLRHQVPGWLTAPPLGPLVLDLREAHRRHGGQGAFYVYLKRRR